MVRIIYLISLKKLTLLLLSPGKLSEPTLAVCWIHYVKDVSSRSHVLAKVNRAVCESDVRIFLGLLGTASWVGKEVEVKFNPFKGVDGHVII